MSGIYGALGLNTTDSQYVYISTFGQVAVFDAVNTVLAQHEADLNAAMSVFVGETTEAHTERYMLPGGGRLQRMGPDGRPAAAKATGSWDVAYPLEEFAASFAASRVAYAYSTVRDLDRHLKSIMQRNINTMRQEILSAILNSAPAAFLDPLWGSLTLKGLATGSTDSVLYPPILGSETEQTLARYAESGYASSGISDTNDPFPTIVNALEASFGTPTGGSRIAVFINNAQTAKVTALTPFTGITNRFVNPGDNVNTVLDLPSGMPGRVLGVHEDSGAIIVEWRWVPADYAIGIHLDTDPPLKKRVDPAAVGLPRGLTLVAESEVYPFTESIYSHRFGIGVSNRIGAYVMEFGTGGTYTVPTGM